jgi:hypothetical protein
MAGDGRDVVAGKYYRMWNDNRNYTIDVYVSRTAIGLVEYVDSDGYLNTVKGLNNSNG